MKMQTMKMILKSKKDAKEAVEMKVQQAVKEVEEAQAEEFLVRKLASKWVTYQERNQSEKKESEDEEARAAEEMHDFPANG